MRYYTSDLHLGHARIIDLCNRPFHDYQHMDEILITNWNKVVAPEDTIYMLGDLALGPKDRWKNMFSRLMGYKVLVIGNHDALFRGNKERYRHKYLHLYDAFDEIYDNIEGHWLDDGTIVNLSHFPYDGDSHDGDRYSEYRLPDTNRPLIHGHTHSTDIATRSRRGTKQVHVGVDAHSYRPVSEDEVIEFLNKIHGRI